MCSQLSPSAVSPYESPVSVSRKGQGAGVGCIIAVLWVICVHAFQSTGLFVSFPNLDLSYLSCSRRSTGAGSDGRLGMGPNVVVCDVWTFSSIDWSALFVCFCFISLGLFVPPFLPRLC